jgi:RNA polymerase sigma factor (sigma-70 family)
MKTAMQPFTTHGQPSPDAPRPTTVRERPLLRPLPQVMDEASTHSSMLHTRSNSELGSRWIYYQQPVRNYLKGLGCSEQDLDDLTHDTLIKLQTYIILNYDSQRPFRPYFKAAIRNFYFDRLRAGSTTQRPVVDSRGADEDSQILVDGLLQYARQVYEHFAIEALPQLSHGVAMLHAWLMDDLTQEELARRWQLSDRQVRTLIARAADALTAWMQTKINQDDLASLAQLASRQGISLDLEVAGIRSLFSHLSKRKRIRVLMVLALIYRDGVNAIQPGQIE